MRTPAGWALLVVTAGLVVRLAFAAVSPREPGALYRLHEAVAINLLEGRGFLAPHYGVPGEQVPFAWYPPGFSMLIALVYSVAGRSPWGVRLLQIAAGSIAALLFGRAAGRAFGDGRLGGMSALAAAVLPVTAVHDVNLSTNTSMTMSLLAVSIWVLYRRARPRTGDCLLCGALAAAAGLFRSEALLMIPVMSLACVIRSGSWRSITAPLLASLLVLTPWTVRNLLVFGVPSPTAPGTGLILLQTIARYDPDPERGLGFSESDVLAAEGRGYTDVYWPDPYGRDRERLETVLGYIGEDPLGYLGILARNTPYSWFGHRLFITTTPSAYSMILHGGLTGQGLAGLADRAAGLLLALVVFGTAVAGFPTSRGILSRTLPFWGGAALYLIVFIPLGALGRYTAPGYYLMIPFSVAGAGRLLNRVTTGRGGRVAGGA